MTIKDKERNLDITRRDSSESEYLDNLEFDRKLNKSWSRFMIDRVRFTLLVIFVIFVAWIIALTRLPLESMPEVDVGMAYIITTLPWASPESVEDLVTRQIEKQITKVNWVDKITSTSMNSSSMIIVQFLTGIDTDIAISELKDKVDLAVPSMPDDASRPLVAAISFDDFPIWTFAIGWDYDGYDLYEMAQNIQDKLETHEYISEVQISGWLQKEYLATIDPKKLEKYSLSLWQVNNAITSSNMTMPIWQLETWDYIHTLNIDSRFYDIQSLKQIVISKSWETWIIRLEDVASVELSHKKVSSESRLSINGSEPKNAITIWVLKKKWWSIVDLVTDWKQMLEDLKKSWELAPDIEITTILDGSEDIKDDLSHLLRDGIITIWLVFIVLFAIIWVKEALVASTRVPLSFLVTFVVLSLTGQTLNFLTMFALILSLWLLVDDAIVIISAINQYKKPGKFTTREAALLVIKDFQRVLITTTLTVVFVFGSMLFMGWIMWSFIFSIPFVITIVMITSLIIALTLNPALTVMATGRDKKFNKEDERWFFYNIFNKWFIPIHKIEKLYGKVLHLFIRSRITAIFVLLTVFVLFVWAISLPILWIVKTEFMPPWDSNNLNINIETEAWTKLERTSEITKQVEEALLQEKDIESFSTSIWTISSADRSSSSWEHLATIAIKLVEKEKRDKKSFEIADKFRKIFASLPDAKVTIEEESWSPGSGTDFEVSIAGPDYTRLNQIILDAKKVLATIPWVIDIKTSRKTLPFEFEMMLDKDMLALHSLSVPEVSSFVRNRVNGTKATSIFIGKDEIDVITSFPEVDIDTLDKIRDLKIRNMLGQDIPLRDITNIDFKPSVFSVERQDSKRVITLSAMAENWYAWNQIQDEFNKKMADYNMPAWYEFITGWIARDMEESVRNLLVAMTFGLIMIVGLLVLLYDSYREAFLVMITIPLSLIWVFYGFAIMWVDLSFPWMIWLVALFGIVVRNGIILFDKINQNLDQELEFREAILDAGVSRLEPVLLTSIVTVLGMIPLSLSNPMWFGLGMSIIFGLSISTFFTLLVLPTSYFMVFRKKYLKKQNSV